MHPGGRKSRHINLGGSPSSTLPLLATDDASRLLP